MGGGETLGVDGTEVAMTDLLNNQDNRELLATYLLRKLKWELLGKTVLLLATVVYQARRMVPTLKEFV
ncbi:MAG: hypothetical protein WBV10_05295, partial [Exiguobacterium marinum]|uniref:hypothetical protein n=1 Tax=Exiguobacterium marinum TaxID=273528 RepID=UPI003C4BDFE5